MESLINKRKSFEFKIFIENKLDFWIKNIARLEQNFLKLNQKILHFWEQESY